METITTISDYLKIIEDLLSNSKKPIRLFRGQSENLPLLPGIARNGNNYDSTNLEKQMLSDFKRRGNLLFEHRPDSEWDYLVMAQHFKMQTRLLDWSSNPLVALWFAVSNPYKINKDGIVYFLHTDKSYLLNDEEISKGPFEITKTRILKPTLNNNRIIAQNGWFTVHIYSKKTRRFVSLENNSDIKEFITPIKIPSGSKEQLIKSLSIMDINNRTIFPDLEGLCLHLNWEHTPRSIEDEAISKLITQLKKDISQRDIVISEYIQLKYPNGFGIKSIRDGAAVHHISGFIKKDLGIEMNIVELNNILRRNHLNPDIIYTY